MHAHSASCFGFFLLIFLGVDHEMLHITGRQDGICWELGLKDTFGFLGIRLLHLVRATN